MCERNQDDRADNEGIGDDGQPVVPAQGNSADDTVECIAEAGAETDQERGRGQGQRSASENACDAYAACQSQEQRDPFVQGELFTEEKTGHCEHKAGCGVQ